MAINKKNPRQAGTGARVKTQHQTSNSNPIDLLLPRLDHPREIAPGKWQARCPAHDDRSPSLSIKEGSDCTVLLKCWAGCSAQAIVEVIGLKLSDLFPRSSDYAPSKAPRYNARDVVQTLLFESTVVTLGYRALQGGGTLGCEDAARIEVAVKAIDACREAMK